MIGLGRMGANMVRRLMKNGQECVVFDRSPNVVHALVKEKATGATSLADFVTKLDRPRAIGSSLIRRSVRVMNAGPEILQASVVQEDPTVLKLNRLPNSIDTLSPNDPFVKEMNTLPMAKHIPYHSIIGDRGRGDTLNSSDGVVPYWSSHLDGAESEKIVPSGHTAHRDPEAIAEIVRILKKNVAGKDSVDRRFEIARSRDALRLAARQRQPQLHHANN